jgi:hypothetical protein
MTGLRVITHQDCTRIVEGFIAAQTGDQPAWVEASSPNQ